MMAKLTPRHPNIPPGTTQWAVRASPYDDVWRLGKSGHQPINGGFKPTTAIPIYWRGVAAIKFKPHAACLVALEAMADRLNYSRRVGRKELDFELKKAFKNAGIADKWETAHDHLVWET